MAKKKKKEKEKLKALLKEKKNKDLEVVEVDDDAYDEAYKKKVSKLLDERFLARDIPLADEGYKRNNSDLSTEALKRFYEEAHVSEFLKAEGKFIHFEFGKLLEPYRVNVDDKGENPLIRRISYAEISKQSFINNINLSIRYINYFIEYFDDDNELMTAYFQIMFILHYKNSKITVEDFVDYVIAFFSTDSMFEKVIRMVEYNTDESLVKKTERTYDESIQLTIEHLKAIMGVSCFHRFVIPVVSHFYTMRGKGLLGPGLSDKDLYFNIFTAFIPKFDDFYGINLYSKIYHTATTRISKTENQQRKMWNRRERFGMTTTSFTHDLMREYINELSQKTVFSRSAIIFLHVCFDRAITNELQKRDKFEMSDMNMEASDSVNESISRWDKWQLDRAGNSEKVRLRAYIAIEDMILRLGYEFGIDFNHMTPEQKAEYDYYNDNIKKPIDDTQLYMINLYFANKLKSSEEIKQLQIQHIIKIIMIMKRDLRSRNYVYLPFFISGELLTATAKKISKKSLEKLFITHPSYEDWKDMFPDTFELLNLDRILGELRTIVSVPTRVVDYDYVENRGEIMTPVDVCVTDEFIRMLCEC